MEDKIEERLKKKYNYCKISVKYEDLRKYSIDVTIMVGDFQFKKTLYHTWDAYFTFDVNVGAIENMIDNFILKIYRKGSKYYD